MPRPAPLRRAARCSRPSRRSARRRYVVGSIDDAVLADESLFDLTLDIGRGELSIARHARAEFQPCSVHKEMSSLIGKACTDSPGDEDQALVKAIALKTRQLTTNIGRMATAAGSKPIGDVLREKNLPLPLVAFMSSLAAAEGMQS